MGFTGNAGEILCPLVLRKRIKYNQDAPPKVGFGAAAQPSLRREGLATIAAAFRFTQNVTHPLSGHETTKNWKIYLPFSPESDIFI